MIIKGVKYSSFDEIRMVERAQLADRHLSNEIDLESQPDWVDLSDYCLIVFAPSGPQLWGGDSPLF